VLQLWLLPILARAEVQFYPLSLPPARTWNAAADSSDDDFSLEQHLEECLTGCEAALGLECAFSGMTRAAQQPAPLPAVQNRLDANSAASPSPLTCAEERVAGQRCAKESRKKHAAKQSRVIVHNLFALEALHIAEALGVESVAVSPCLVPYAAPTSFEARFIEAFPRLYRRLQHEGKRGTPSTVLSFVIASARTKPQASLDVCSTTGDGVTWAEVEHWLWPLFTQRWGSWRQNRLHLPPVPFLNAIELPHAPLLLYCLSPQLVHAPPYWPASVKVSNLHTLVNMARLVVLSDICDICKF
jgi:hypothetical protein